MEAQIADPSVKTPWPECREAKLLGPILVVYNRLHQNSAGVGRWGAVSDSLGEHRVLSELPEIPPLGGYPLPSCCLQASGTTDTPQAELRAHVGHFSESSDERKRATARFGMGHGVVPNMSTVHAAPESSTTPPVGGPHPVYAVSRAFLRSSSPPLCKAGDAIPPLNR